MAIKWKSISAHVGTKLIRVAVFTAILGAVLIGMGIMVGENFALVFDQVEYVGSARAKHLLNRGHSFAWELFTSYPDPERQRMAEFNLSDPIPFFYYVREGDSSAMTNIGAVDDVQALFQALPLFYRSEGAKTDLIIYVGVPETVFAAEAAQYILDRGRVSAAFVSIIVGLLVLALGASGVAYAAWRPALHTMAQPRWWDKMPLELCVGVIVWLSLYSAEMMPGLRFAFQREGTVGWLAAGVLLIVALAMLGLCYVYLASRHLRGRTFIQHTFIGAVVLGVIKLLQVDPVSWRGVLFTCFAVASTFLTLLLMETAFSQAVGALVVFAVFLALHGATLVYVLRRAKDIKRIATGAEAIRQGDTTHRIAPTEHRDLKAIVEPLNDIAQGLERAVQSQVKAERMKMELITNVSHDLRTPLTSLLTYIDLLKKEGLHAEDAPRYLAVLEQKSLRLKVLTDDLFDAAKAASGTMAVNREKIDIVALLAQGLGELADKITASKLEFRVNMPSEPLGIFADGKLVWRAIENVLMNAIKYAVPESRVYVEAQAKGAEVELIIKNVSALPLNMPPEELLERFVRGDSARSSEGSGLGLSIAKSLLELQQGQLNIEIDGDLFKVIMTLPRWQEN